MITTLALVPLHTRATLIEVRGERALRRRLMEHGLVPGTEVAVTNVAPLGDPLEISVRGARLSLRRNEAAGLRVRV